MSAADTWLEANRRTLAAHYDRLATRLGSCAEGMAPAGDVDVQADDAAPEAMAPAAAIDTLAARFGLSPFERDVLLLAAAIELDGRFAPLCARASGVDAGVATFALALATLEGAHWSALTPDAPLRRWRLLELAPHRSLTAAALTIDERVLHYLVGLDVRETRVTGVVSALPTPPLLVEREVECVRAIGRAFAADAPASAVQLVGPSALRCRAVASGTAVAFGRTGLALASAMVPALASDAPLVALVAREVVLADGLLVLSLHDADVDVGGLERLIHTLDVPLVVLTRARLDGLGAFGPVIELPALRYAERRLLWERTLGPLATTLDGDLSRLALSFSPDAGVVRDAVEEASDEPGTLGRALHRRARLHARSGLDQVAERVESTATVDDLVLAPQQAEALRELVMHARQRARVFEDWGMGRGPRGQGLTALFAGPSGCGKSLGAAVVANALELELYRVDLAAVVSKYVGETEKNLARVFDRAEAAGAVLLFDEADALFGKRSEVRDSHDRYANIEVSYLLQRMEAYDGLAILTTNMLKALDPAFLRRIRFVVQFSFPDVVERRAIWARAFPPEAPTEPLDLDRLADLELTGASIRNVALGAAFRAADAGGTIGMPHVFAAARGELARLERPMADARARG